MLNSIPLQRQNGLIGGRDHHHHHPYLSKKKSKEAANRHAMAESERRKRINSHLSTLRKLFPRLPKKDKPRVLTEAVKQLRELRKKVADQLAQHQNGASASTPLFLPGESDEVAVVPHTPRGEIDGLSLTTTVVKATICCEDRPGLNQDLTEAVQSVKGRLVKAEMATVGGRTKVDVVVQCGGGGGAENDVIAPLRRALRAVVENRSLGSSMFLCRRLQAEKMDSFVNRSAQTCSSFGSGIGLASHFHV